MDQPEQQANHTAHDRVLNQDLKFQAHFQLESSDKSAQSLRFTIKRNYWGHIESAKQNSYLFFREPDDWKKMEFPIEKCNQPFIAKVFYVRFFMGKGQK